MTFPLQYQSLYFKIALMMIIINQLWSNLTAKPTPRVWLISQSKLKCKSSNFAFLKRGFQFPLAHQTTDLRQVKLLCWSLHYSLKLWVLSHSVTLGTMLCCVVLQTPPIPDPESVSILQMLSSLSHSIYSLFLPWSATNHLVHAGHGFTQDQQHWSSHASCQLLLWNYLFWSACLVGSTK